MEQQKSPVEIVQKLLAINTTRKEASERMIKNNASLHLQEKLKSVAVQSDSFMKALLNELSQFGDAVQPEVSRDDEYHQTWNNAIGDIDTIDASLLSDTFSEMEYKMMNIYSETSNLYPNLPVTLKDLLNTQIQELKQISQ